MCKIMAIPTVTPETTELAWKLTQEMGKLMSKGNSDGLGYAAINGEGDLFGERWLFNYEAFDMHTELSSFDKSLVAEHGGFLHKEERYNKFGPVTETSLKAMILHTRWATSAKGFGNTHPFVDGSTALIHNGVIDNINKNDLKQSTCDSEKILNEYVKNKVMNTPTNIRRVIGALEGYFACAVLSRTKEGMPILDIFKETTANLSAAYVKELGSLVITTQMQDLSDAAKILNLTITSFYEVKPGVMLRYNVMTGDVIGATRFKVKKRDFSNYEKYKRKSGAAERWKHFIDDIDDREDWEYGTTGMHPRSSGITDMTRRLPPSSSETIYPERPLRILNDYEIDGWAYDKQTKVWARVK